VAFGGIPIQRLGFDDAVKVVRGVIDLGVNFIDTANGYTDSEEKIGAAIKGIPRDEIVIATKSGARDGKTFTANLDLSLKRLDVDYIDLYQMHGVSSAEAYDQVFAEGGAFDALMAAVKAGKVRFPSFSSHNFPTALRMMETDKFDMVQLPFNYVDAEALDKAIPLAKKLDMGFIAMKPFGGGLLSDAGLSMRYLLQFDSVVADPGIEKLAEMEEIVRIVEAGEKFSQADAEAVERVKKEMGANWCHRCDYCQPCPNNIPISMVLNVGSFMKRIPPKRVVEMAAGGMETAKTCSECRACVGRCPYNLDVPALIKDRLGMWEKFMTEKV
jgi:predicted aldo/keto reductase-like oxidoreductase